MSVIASAGVAVPANVLSPAQTKQLCLFLFRDVPEIERLVEVVDRSGVERRFLCNPPAYYLQPRSFEDRNLDYQRHALALGERAIRACLEPVGLEPQDIDHLIFVTTTGLATPSIDALLAHRLGLRQDVLRTPIFGVGCAGGAVGLARAADFANLGPGRRILVLSVELCGQTLQAQDRSKRSLVAASLFGDGAAAVLVTSDDLGYGGPHIVESRSTLFPDSEGIMGWHFHGGGMELRLRPDVPELVKAQLAPHVEDLMHGHGLVLQQVEHLILHPGGAKVLTAYEKTLKLPADRVLRSREILRDYGNLSSATVLFILWSILEQDKPAEGDSGLILALGPGFAAEQLLLRW